MKTKISNGWHSSIGSGTTPLAAEKLEKCKESGVGRGGHATIRYFGSGLEREGTLRCSGDGCDLDG